MKTNFKSIYFLAILGFFTACHKEQSAKTGQAGKPVVSKDGQVITLSGPKESSLFKVESLAAKNIEAAFTAPGRIVATVVPSVENKQQNVVLFDNPDLTATYTAILQHIINVNQKKIAVEQRKATISRRKAIINQRQAELARYQELADHGAATGKDLAEIKIDINNEETNLLSAQADLTSSETELADEKTAILEDEAKLKIAGFNPLQIIKAKASTVWSICDVPENQIGHIKAGHTCTLQFTSFPDQKFTGRVEEVGDVVDNITRMVKLRISLINPSKQLRAGMFAIVQFGISQGFYIAVPKGALITVQGKHYVFVKKSETVFERREVMIGQQIDDKVVVFSGLANDESIAITNVMQLKGLSFGY
ncbi:RND family efflux transporter, MFP subunit [Pseudarcicella hirudinis]|uniref:RND family efflux transporter, MFP subunit n=1 Tax=Pseudarcicella hirudinis TaxID=1079859 RepID=A0A1I5MJL6_9BACT|nr:efflux RND transporter periplasmic adaptor subunit [Pseudarcicella hirudinis]SFP09497.1 RND family efflux transporter, MFP subunit [Pseudarcicella hirudinis]